MANLEKNSVQQDELHTIPGMTFEEYIKYRDMIIPYFDCPLYVTGEYGFVCPDYCLACDIDGCVERVAKFMNGEGNTLPRKNPWREEI